MSQEQPDKKLQLPVEASNPAISAQRLEILCAGPELQSLVASNPATPAHLLAQLALDQAAQVRQAVAGNPNTPWRTLEQLAWEFPSEFLHNPIGQLQMVAHPEQISTDKAFWEALLRVAPIPSLWWNWLLAHPALCKSDMIRLHVQHTGEAAHPYGSMQKRKEHILLILSELLGAAHAQGAELPALTSLSSHHTGEQMLTERIQWLESRAIYRWVHSTVRQTIAGKTQTAREVLLLLARDHNAGVRRTIAANTQTPAEALLLLAQDDGYWVRRTIAANTHTPTEALLLLAQDPDVWIRYDVAMNKHTPEEIQLLLAQDQNRDMRYALAVNAQTHENVLKLLAHDLDDRVRRAVAWNKQTPEEILHLLAHDQDPGVRCNVAGNPQTPVETLRILAHDQLWIRRYVAEHPLTPGDVLQTLVQDENMQVRIKIAEHKQTPTEVLQTLAQHENTDIREAVATNPGTPEEVLLLLAQEPDQLIRYAVTRNPQIPASVFRLLALDQLKDVRKAVASHPQAPGIVLQALALDQLKDVRKAVASHPQAPGIVLQALALDHEVEIQLAVLQNPHTPGEVLQILARDPDRDERVGWVAKLFLKLRAGYESPSIAVPSSESQNEHDRCSSPPEQAVSKRSDSTVSKPGEWQELCNQLSSHGMLLALRNKPPEEQMVEIISLHVPDSVRQTLLATVAADWDTASTGRSFACTDILARNPQGGAVTVKTSLHTLMVPFLPEIALQKFATSSRWEVRYLVALHARTPQETRQLLSQDGNCYVRAMARAKEAQKNI